MNERNLYIQIIPQIAEMIMEVQQMTNEQYEEFKQDYLDEVREKAPAALGFIEKVITVIDTYLQEEGRLIGKD